MVTRYPRRVGIEPISLVMAILFVRSCGWARTFVASIHRQHQVVRGGLESQTRKPEKASASDPGNVRSDVISALADDPDFVKLMDGWASLSPADRKALLDIVRRAANNVQL